MGVSVKFTYEDLQHIPPDRNRYEIVDGELFVSPSPIPLHQRIVGNLFGELRTHVRKHHLGEVFVAPCDIVFTSSTVLEPDVFFVSKPRLDIIGPKHVSGPPDLVVEVLSESSSRLDREIKFSQYALHGVTEYWLIDPYGKTTQIFRLEGNQFRRSEILGVDDVIASPLLPGFSLPLASLWE